MSVSPTFVSIPKSIFVTVATEIDGEKQPQHDFHLTPEHADEHGILIIIDRFLKADRPLKLNLIPENAPVGTLVMATPDDFTFTAPVTLIAPEHIHLYRKFEEGSMQVTCLVPLIKTEHVNLEKIRRNIWNSLDDGQDYEQNMTDYYGELMIHHHVLSLDYTDGVTESYEYFHNIEVMQRHFCYDP